MPLHVLLRAEDLLADVALVLDRLLVNVLDVRLQVEIARERQGASRAFKLFPLPVDHGHVTLQVLLLGEVHATLVALEVPLVLVHGAGS